MSTRTYVPGYGYVEAGSPGTSGSVKSGNKRVDTGQGGQGRQTWFYRTTTGLAASNTSQGTPDFVVDESGATAASGPWISNQQSYEYPTWAALDQRTRDLYNDIAKAYNVNSTGKAWYRDDFLPYVRQILEETGIAPDPENVALTFARQAGYDVSDYLESSPVLSPNSILFDTPMGDRTGEPGTGSSSGGSGSYGGGVGYGGGGGGGGGSVSLTNPTSARGLLLQTMQGVLGRNPTEREYKDFIDTLKQTELANPRTVSVEGDVAVQSGGTDPSMLALEFTQAADDYKATQANKFYNAFMGALGGGLNG